MAGDLERARKLVALAADSRTPRHEAEQAAIAACRLIASTRLLEQQTSERSEPAPVRPTRLMQELLCTRETSEKYVFFVLGPDFRSRGSSQQIEVPKRYVRAVGWMSEEEKRERKLTGRVALYLDVDPGWVSRVSRGRA